MNRKEFLKKMSIGATAVFFAPSIFLESCRKTHIMEKAKKVSVIEGDFQKPLPTPEVVSATSASLVAKQTTACILNGKISRVYGYHDSILGPTLQIVSGQSVNINFNNTLGTETNVHWHGLITPAALDGFPTNTVSSGASINYNFPVNQRAAAYWYHPHPDGKTAYQAYMGLAGMFIVNDGEEAALNLPSGPNEIPLVIQDKRIYSDYSLNYSPTYGDIMSGYFGEYVLVNGVYSPFINVATRFYRLRVLNGSNARVYNLGFTGGMSFHVIGSDGGLLSTPNSVTNLLLAPGERVDLLVDFSNYSIGSEIYLQSSSFNSGDSVQGEQTFKIMKFIVDQSLTNSFTLPTSLSVVNPIPASSSSRTRTFDIGGMMNMGSNGGMMGGGMGSGMGSMGFHTINGKVFSSSRVDEAVLAGSTEIWVFDNTRGGELHPMHLHGVQFQVISRIGGRGSLIATESGWKDTVLVMPGEKVTVIMTFPQYKGKFVLHCHNLEHEDSGMMLTYEIV